MPVASTDELWDSLDDWLRDRAQTLLTSAENTNDDLTRLTDTLTRSVLDWRQEKLKRLGADVKRLCEETASQGDAVLLLTYTHQRNTLMQQERSIDRARHAMSADSRRKTE
ncbi:MAG: hypothetical protein IPL78_01190 [Chloroflexi bacterium]|nr:hypothetical protein [Chloroflexota bacterium]